MLHLFIIVLYLIAFGLKMNVQFQHILRPVFQCPLSPDHRTHKSRINPFLIRFPAIRVRHLHAQHTLFQLQRAYYRTWQIITQRDIVDINVRRVDNINIRRRVVLTNVSGLPYRQPSGYIRVIPGLSPSMLHILVNRVLPNIPIQGLTIQ